MTTRHAIFGLLLLLVVTPSLGAQEPEQLSGLQAALIMEKAMVDSIAKAEKSVVAIARVRVRRGLIAPRFREGGAIVEPTDPSFVPNEYATGVVIDRAGLILTNYHVLGDPDPAKNSYYVWIDRKPFVASVLAGDPWTDLAVLSIDADDLQPIQFGDASKLKKGQIVIALGNPYAIARDGQASASWGIISNLSRKQTEKPTTDNQQRNPDGTLHHLGTLIQTDAKLNLGTSGGALVNLKGEMVGLTTSLAAMEKYEQAAGFAIPVDDTFRRTIDKLKRGEKADFGFLGVQAVNLAAQERRRGEWGVRLASVLPGTPAGQAGLRDGDLLSHVNGVAVHDAVDLMRELAKHPAEAQVRLTIQRGLRQVRPVVQLSKKYIESSRRSYSQEEERTWRGVRVDFATAIRGFYYKVQNLDPRGCVAIVDVEYDSPAWKAGLRDGTFVNFVNGDRVSTPEEFFDAVEGQAGSVRLRLTVAEGSDTPIRLVSP